MHKVVISIIGRDQPGIHAAVSGILLAQGCNIENVSQTILQTMFGALFIVAIPDTIDADSLCKRLQNGAAKLELQVTVRPFATPNPPVAAVATNPFVVTTLGPDRPGLVAAITSCLAGYQINITNLTAVFTGGADPGGNIMIFEIDVPQSIDLPALYADLEQTAATVGLEINIQHRQIFQTMNKI